MRALIVYESMFGNTHRVAEMIGEALGEHGDATVVPVPDARPEMLEGIDLLVVGGPTHVHGMSRPSTRRSAPDSVTSESDLTLDPDWEGDGVREWLGSLGDGGSTRAAAFDTRIDVSPMLSGRASKGIAKKLRHHGFSVVVEPESFLVTKENHLEPDEAAHARRWADDLASTLRREQPSDVR